MLKKDSLIKGTIILAVAALVARVLGIFQRVPLDYVMGSAGGAALGLANQFYLWLLIIATGGIPSAISRMVSERHALGKAGEAQRIYKAALLFGAVAGVIMAAVLYFIAPWYSTHLSRFPLADKAIQAIAPALLLFPTIAMMRGYFQGRQMMAAGGMSQIVEQILRVLLGVGLAFLVVSWGYGDRWIAAAASAGSVFGGVGALAVMIWYGRKLGRMDAAEVRAGRMRFEKSNLPFRSIYKEIFTMSLPIVVTAMTVNLLYLFDSSFLVRLSGDFYTALLADKVADAFSMKAVSLAGIPPILAIALSSSIIPVISSAFAVRNMNEVTRQSSLIMRIVVFTGVPAALIMTVAAESLTGLVFENVYGVGIVALLTAGTIFQISMMTSNSILYGFGTPRIPMNNTLIGLAVKLVASVALAPLLGIYGMILGSTLCYIVITVLNLRAIRQVVPVRTLGGKWVGYIAAVIATGAVGFGIDYGVRTLLLDAMPHKLAYLFSCCAAGAAAGIVYVVLLVLLRVVQPSDLSSFPGPLRKLFRPLMRLAPASARG
ncbi:putative polysaccharide biosynthesis protein [Paenibacillus sp. MMS18-CY102]|uniref:putative polysaccharide biosynthesis protein n=1 Tax=Paenibacillus sp. MMS18-CY102 TaxID=2682849 RepID=UPI0013660971|nr:polysaccharide biosynthesis protein [Paenibacillus sp. MMS18-CY102]MWC29546.1 oligosaccharide flippase family protein [Paenibacillus sp. MMS18-CY102]